MKPFFEYYIINNNYKINITLSNDEFDKCKPMENSYICFNTYIYNVFKQTSPCELKLIFNKEIRNIETRDMRITTQVESL